MEKILKYSGVVALIIIAILGIKSFLPKTPMFGATSCANITCLSGGLRLVSDAGGDFESDVAAVFNSTVTNNGLVSYLAGIKIGTNGTTINRENFGNCAILAYATTIAASSSATVDCSSNGLVGGTLTGVSSGDNVVAVATTSISSTFQGVSIRSVNASTTNGYLTLQVFNGTGTTFTWTGTASSTIAYHVLH